MAFRLEGGQLPPLPPVINRFANERKSVLALEDALIREGVDARKARLIAVASKGSYALDRAIDSATTRTAVAEVEDRTVIIGGGLHAAIYASVAAQLGERPVVLERRQNIGGIFAAGRRPLFYLNSRNRPGDGDPIPGTSGPLNLLPGAELQLSDLSTLEYPTNRSMATVIRLLLLINADCYTNTPATLNLPQGARRMIVTTGLGDSKIEPVKEEEQPPEVMTFEEFLSEQGNSEERFPLRDYKRVAVIGANDSGRVVVEWLLGQGPAMGMSVPNIHWVSRIDWFGQPALFKEVFEQAERSRYRGIGRYMPRQSSPGYYFRVAPRLGRVTLVDFPYVRYREGDVTTRKAGPFDHIIVCSGFRDEFGQSDLGLEPFYVASQVVGKRYSGKEMYRLGPCADLEVTDEERAQTGAFDAVPDNSTALFRYGTLTAMAAKHLTEGGS